MLCSVNKLCIKKYEWNNIIMYDIEIDDLTYQQKY